MKKYFLALLSVFLLIASMHSLVGQTIVPGPFVKLNLSSESSVIYKPFSIEWECIDPESIFPEYQMEYRYKLDVPGDWRGGIKYNINKWSDWFDGTNGRALYNDFILEGKYTISVQCRNKNSNRTSEVTYRSFSIDWEYPEIQEEAFNIDWSRVEAADNDKEKYTVLADEFMKAHLMWNLYFEYQHRLLLITTPPEEIINSLASIVLEESILEMVSEQTAKLTSKLLLPKTIYELIKQGYFSLAVIYRVGEANKASSMTAVSYRAWKYFEKKASQAKVEQVTFTDPRDGEAYKLVKIGNQLWIGENLRFSRSNMATKYDGSWGGSALSKGEACYDNYIINCQKYGKLYNYELARSACPDGWRLPHLDEFEVLQRISRQDIDLYKSLLEGGTIGFNALLAGSHGYFGGFSGLGRETHWWTSYAGLVSLRVIENKIYLNLNPDSSSIEGWGSFAVSVRCIKDE